MAILALQHPEPIKPVFKKHDLPVNSKEVYFLDEPEQRDSAYAYVFHAQRLFNLDLDRCEFSGYEDAERDPASGVEVQFLVDGTDVAWITMAGLPPGRLCVHMKGADCFDHPFLGFAERALEASGLPADYPYHGDFTINAKTGAVTVEIIPL